MFISQKKAKQILRERAGYSVDAANLAITKLAKTVFGKREKVKSADIERLVRDASKPSVAVKKSMFSPRRAAQLRANAGRL